MPAKRKAEDSLAGPSKKVLAGPSNTTLAGPRKKKRAVAPPAVRSTGRVGLLNAAYGSLFGAIQPAMRELEARPAEEFGDETLREENRQFLRLAEATAQQMAAGEAKRRLVEEQMLRLREEERRQVDRQLLAVQERAREELIIHAKMDVMQLVRDQARAPHETDADVRLSSFPNDRVAMKATGARSHPLYGAVDGQGRFYVETSAMFEDWEERMDEVPPEDRGRVLPRSYEQVKAAQSAKNQELARAVQAQREVVAEERAAEAQRLRELAEVQRRLPPIPAHAPGQHPEYRRRKGQVKWSKRPVGWEPYPPLARVRPIREPKAPKKPKGKGKGKRRQK